MLGLCLALATLGQAEVPLEGTQPNELQFPPEPSSVCGCHFDFDATSTNEPGQSYAATVMALSARDPLFLAALELAHRDQPRLSPTCLRCHAPVGWLGGASEPGDGSMLQPEHLEGVTCDVCHRMVEPTNGTHIGDGQYEISPSFDKRGGRGTGPTTGHRVVQSDYIKSSELCGVCHSLFNPLEDAHDADGNKLGFNYYEQRTYEEWRDSAVSGQKGCVDCHMKRIDAYSCREQVNRYPDMARHSIVGGNTFAPRAVALLYPQLDLQDEVDQLRIWVAEQLAQAADLEIVSPAAPLTVESGRSLQLQVRLTNKTGHKLPTGYPEGRRVYLEVTLDLDDRDPIIVSGAWDPSTGNIIDDPQLRTYETAHGKVGQGRTRHLALANQILLDTRIPPEGFRPTHADMVPVGRDYGSPPYRNYDEHTYTIPMPPGITLATTGTVAVRALHQTTSGTYVNFLIDAIGSTEPRAMDLRRVFAALGRAEPEPMVRVSMPITVVARTPDPIDAGFEDASGVVDAGRISTQPGDACSCGASNASKLAPWRTTAIWGLVFIAFLFRRKLR